MKTNIDSRLSIKIALALGAIYLIWGSTYLGIRLAIETIPPYLMSGFRFVIAGVILYVWSRWKGVEPPKAVHWRSAAIIGGFLLLGGNATVAWAEQRVPSGIASLLIATMPMWIVLLDWLWHKGARPTGRVVSGLLLGFLGILLLVNQGHGVDSQAIDLIGVGALLMAAMLWSIGSLYSRKAALPKSPIQGIGMQMLAGGVLVCLAGIAGGELQHFDIGSISVTSFISWGYLTIFGSMIGFTCYIWLLKVAPAERVATYAYVNPVIAVFLGWAIVGEVITLQTLIASALIIVSVVLIIKRKKAPDKIISIKTPKAAAVVIPPERPVRKYPNKMKLRL